MIERELDDDDVAAIGEAVQNTYGVAFDMERARALAGYLDLKSQVDEYALGMSASRLVSSWSKDQ